jgi:hypothetical protein
MNPSWQLALGPASSSLGTDNRGKTMMGWSDMIAAVRRSLLTLVLLNLRAIDKDDQISPPGWRPLEVPSLGTKETLRESNLLGQCIHRDH